VLSRPKLKIRQAYDWRSYDLPNDTVEQNRLNLQHSCFRLAMDGALFLSPIPENAAVLDVGCGTGKVM
jgi:tRNA1(Val) A37 N6-methylase TrmN6